MKSERRHELEHNELADWIEQKVTAIKNHTNTILGVLILVLAASAAYMWWLRNETLRSNMAWDGIAVAIDDESASDLDNLAELYDGTNSGQWASLIAGDIHLANGCKVLLDNRDNADQELSDAVAAYSRVVESSTPMFRQWAKYGLARAFDAQCTFDAKCNTKKAIAAYEAVVTEFPKGAYASAAQRRLDDLKKPTTVALYMKINKHESKPLSTGIPNPFGSNRDFNLDSLGDGEGLGGFKSLMELDSPDDSAQDKTPKPDEKSSDETPTPDAADTTPADDSAEE